MGGARGALRPDGLRLGKYDHVYLQLRRLPTATIESRGCTRFWIGSKNCVVLELGKFANR